MKIDIEMLRKAVNKKLISEQVNSFESPVEIYPGAHTDVHEEHDDYSDGCDECRMVKQNLFQLSVYAAKLHDMLQEGENVEEWVQEKIVEAVTKISDVYHYMEYQNYRESD